VIGYIYRAPRTRSCTTITGKRRRSSDTTLVSPPWPPLCTTRPDFFGATGKAVYYNGTITVPIVDKLTMSGGIGHQSFSRSSVTEWTDYNVGLTYAFDWVTLDVRWYDTNYPKALGTITDGTATWIVSDSASSRRSPERSKTSNPGHCYDGALGHFTRRVLSLPNSQPRRLLPPSQASGFLI